MQYLYFWDVEMAQLLLYHEQNIFENDHNLHLLQEELIKTI